ncbi:MAG: phosphatase PAP2 family protein [Desulfovibrio sp.]|jgi:undecaprenyl-diphosphatase|nr:phosphatase PAP2 family protein [Desulfovibrio sp.]
MRSALKQTLRTFPWMQLIVCLVPLGAVLACLALFVGTGNDAAREFYRLRALHPELTRGIRLFSAWTQNVFYAFWFILLVYGLRVKKKDLARRALWFFVVQFVFSFVLVRVVKVAFGFPRPYAALAGAGVVPFSFDTGQHSFPSGHTTTVSISAYCTAALGADLLLSLLMGLVLAGIGFSRVYLGMHHILDVSAGLVFGAFGSFCFHYLCNRGST